MILFVSGNTHMHARITTMATVQRNWEHWLWHPLNAELACGDNTSEGLPHLCLFVATIPYPLHDSQNFRWPTRTEKVQRWHHSRKKWILDAGGNKTAHARRPPSSIKRCKRRSKSGPKIHASKLVRRNDEVVGERKPSDETFLNVAKIAEPLSGRRFSQHPVRLICMASSRKKGVWNTTIRKRSTPGRPRASLR